MLMPYTSVTPSAAIDDPRWTAVATRDRRADGSFVYAVRLHRNLLPPVVPEPPSAPRSCGVLRPPGRGCRGGFRACRRCAPETADRRPAARKVFAALSLLDRAEPGHEPSLEALAAHAGCSVSYLQRAFVRDLGVSPREYAGRAQARPLQVGSSATDAGSPTRRSRRASARPAGCTSSRRARWA